MDLTGIDTHTRLCGVIGNPVEHSLSPAMHNAAFEAAGLNYVYLAFRVEDVAGCLAGTRALPSFRGLSVTIPHKMAVIPYLDELEDMAAKVGSVNTITNENGRLIGSTTDGPGTLRAFEEAGAPLDGRNVLIIGSGGAVRAVAFAMADMRDVARITILGRTPARVAAIVDDLRGKTRAKVFSGNLQADLTEAMNSHDVVIQGTSVGMAPNETETCVAAQLFRPEQVAFDMVYRPLKTRFIRDAAKAGCKVILGLEMLVNQAVLQFERWTGVAAPRGVMRAALLERLGADA